MLTISKVFTFLSILPVWELKKPCKLSKQISKLFFQMGAQVYSAPSQTEWRRKARQAGRTDRQTKRQAWW